MAEKDLVSMAQAFTGLPMNDLIGGPLMAAAEANNQMAITQAKYILDTGFHKKKDIYEPVIVQMKLNRPVIIPGFDKDGKPDPKETVIHDVESVVSVPLISIIPVNALAVDNVDITFDMEVKSSYAQERSQETQEKLAAESSFEAKIGYGPFSASISGSVAYAQESRTAESEKFEKSNTARYHVAVHASQQPQPKGLALMLEQFARNVGPFVLGDETKTSPKALDEIINDAIADRMDDFEEVSAGGGRKASARIARASAGRRE